VSENASKFNRVALLGTGLMGGSLGMALRERGLAVEIIGYDRNRSSLETALERGAVDFAADTPEHAAEGAELVILAVPVRFCRELLMRCIPHIAPGTIITDLGSTKEYLAEELTGILPAGVSYIGGHPMTGSEESGIGAADPVFFENAIYVLTPDEYTDKKQLKKLERMVEGIGAQPILLPPREHDRLVALVSHLPHLAAVALVKVAALNGQEDMVQTLAAGGFRDTTRVAMGNPEIWRDICATNREAIDVMLTRYVDELEKIRVIINGGKESELENTLDMSRDYRRRIPYRSRGILPELFDLVVLVKDTPGIIGKIATTLGGAGINIAEVEILHVREEEGGSIRFGFRESEHRDSAVNLLNEKGYRAHRR
jgi:prephenate dehydrogenase